MDRDPMRPLGLNTSMFKNQRYSLFDGCSAIAPMLLCAVVLVVPMYTSQDALNVTFSLWQSTLFRPSTIMAGLWVWDTIPSLCCRSFGHAIDSLENSHDRIKTFVSTKIYLLCAILYP